MIVFGKNPEETVETAVVIEKNDKMLKVQLQKNAACSSCGANGICHPSGQESHIVEIYNEIGADIGDSVVLETNPYIRLLSAFIVFGIPLLLVVIGAVFGNNMNSDTPDQMVVGAITGLALGMLLVYYLNKLLGKKVRFKPRAVKIV